MNARNAAGCCNKDKSVLFKQNTNNLYSPNNIYKPEYCFLSLCVHFFHILLTFFLSHTNVFIFSINTTATHSTTKICFALLILHMTHKIKVIMTRINIIINVYVRRMKDNKYPARVEKVNFGRKKNQLRYNTKSSKGSNLSLTHF